MAAPGEEFFDPMTSPCWRRKAAAARQLAELLSRAGFEMAKEGMLVAANCYERLAALLEGPV